jgi:hypothetical protein
MQTLLMGVDGGPPITERKTPSETEFDALCDTYGRVVDSLRAFKDEHGLARHELLFVDCVVMAPLIWLQRVMSSERLDNLLSRNGENISMMFDVVRKYLDVDEGARYVAGPK